MKINSERNTSTSEESNDIKNENESIKMTKVSEEEIEKNSQNIINIKNILSKNKTLKQKEEKAYEEIKQYIINEKIDITKVKDNKNFTLIQIFVLNNEDYFLRCIFLYLEKELNDEEFFEYLMYNKNTFGMNIFEISSEVGEIKIFRILKKYLTDNKKLLNRLINDYKNGKENIFHIAAKNNKIISLLFFYSFYYNNNTYNSILNIQNECSQTPLHIACNFEFYNFAKYLIDLGVNINCKDKDNKTPLFYAVQSESLKIIKFLIISGADKNIKDKEKNIALTYTDNQNILDILENKTLFQIICKCQTQYENIKNHHRNLVMIILLIFLMIFHCYIAIKYKLSGFLINCNYDLELYFDYVILIISVIFEFLSLLLYLFFQIIKTKKENENIDLANKFCLKENGIQYYEMFKYNENICVICRRVKEMNTKHCIACNVCVDEFDHHCFFLNACITKKNSKYFHIFVVVILMTICFNIILSIKFFIDLVNEPKLYYGLFINECNFNTNEFIIFDYIISSIDLLYFLLCFLTILSAVIPLIVNLIRKKRNNNNFNFKDKSNSPLLPIE